MANVLLEREAALSAVNAVIDRAVSGRGAVILLSGEAGVGKTSVCQAAIEEAGRRAVPVWRGLCDALATPQALGPFRDIAAECGDEGLSLLGAAGAYQIASAFLDLMLRSGPRLVVIEDVHWADEASLDLLRHLGRRIEATSVAMVVSYRDDELDGGHPLRALIGEMSGAEPATRVKLHPLSLQAVGILARDTEIDAGELYRQTGGNPFFVTEVLAAGGAALPAAVHDAVLARAARLSPDARIVLEAASVVPLRVELELLLCLCPGREEAVDECERRGMLVADGFALRFRHELARTAVESEVPVARRTVLHSQVLEWLTGFGDDELLSRMVHHAAAAGDSASVLRYAPSAAERAAAVGAHREAAAHCAAAVRFGDGRLDASELAELVGRQALECAMSDQMAPAVALNRRALALWESAGDVLRSGDALTRLSRALLTQGEGAEARAVGDRAIATLEACPPGPELARALSARAGLAMRADDFEEALDYGGRAVALAESLGEEETAVHALINMGSSEFERGADPDARMLRTAIARAAAAGLAEHVGRGSLNLAMVHLFHRDYPAASRALDQAIAYADEHGFEVFVGLLRAERARLRLETGDLAGAGEEASQVLRRYQAQDTRTVAFTVLGRVRARRGDPGALDALDQAWRMADDENEMQYLGPAAAGLLEAAVLLGVGLDQAAEAGERALAEARGRGTPWLRGELYAWLHRLGRVFPVEGQVAEPWQSELDGNGPAAAEAWERLGCRYEAAMALAWTDSELATAAVEQLHRLGARQAAIVAARRLHGRGVRGVPRGSYKDTLAGPVRLTRREQEVLALMGESASTRDMARRLFVSERTVEHHVAAVLRKLGVSTRADAVAEARRLELLA